MYKILVNNQRFWEVGLWPKLKLSMNVLSYLGSISSMYLNNERSLGLINQFIMSNRVTHHICKL